MAGSVDAGKGRKSHQETNLHQVSDFEPCQVKIAESQIICTSAYLFTFAKPFRCTNKNKIREKKELL